MGLRIIVLQSASIVGRIFNLVKKIAFNACNIVHVHNPTTLQYAVITKLLTSSKLILTDHAQTRGIARIPNKIEWRFVDQVVAVSKDTAEKTHLLGYKGKVQVIYNGIVNQSLPLRDRKTVRNELGVTNEIVLINVAGLLHVKGHDILLNALKILESDDLNYKFFIAGKGPEEEKLLSLAKSLDLYPKYVEFLGFRMDVPDLLNASDIFVLPSRNEGLPISILEAMSLKLPVIVSNVGGNGELVEDGKHGFVVEKENEFELAEKIKKLILDENSRKELGLAGFNHVKKNFSFSDMVNKYNDVYDGSMESPK